MRNGLPLVYCHKGGRSLAVFEGALHDPDWPSELTRLVTSKKIKSLEIQKINGDPIADHPEVKELLLAGGFKPGYKGPTFRR